MAGGCISLFCLLISIYSDLDSILIMDGIVSTFTVNYTQKTLHGIVTVS